MLKVTFVGLPGTGKTLLALALRDKALEFKYNVCLIDEATSTYYVVEDPRGYVEIKCVQEIPR